MNVACFLYFNVQQMRQSLELSQNVPCQLIVDKCTVLNACKNASDTVPNVIEANSVCPSICPDVPSWLARVSNLDETKLRICLCF
jgi:hypothetical protein